jgi:lysophospholipase L1-like esterase
MTNPTITPEWTTSYLAALAGPGQTLAFLPKPRSFYGQTVRQTVRLRRGGDRIRLVLSNEYGTEPLIIDQITLTNPATGDSAPALHTGGDGWTIPSGQTAASDPADLPINLGDELTVDCYLAQPTPPGSYLHSAQRTGQVAPGNQTGETQLSGAEPFTALYWIAQVLVDEPAAGPVVIAFGDSIARGDGTTIDQDQRYPDHLQRRLLTAGVDGAVVLNAGHGGNRLLRPVAGPSMTDRYARDVLTIHEATHVIILAGTNDIGLPHVLNEQPPAAQDIIDGLLALAQRAGDRGVRPILATISPILASRYEFFLADGNEDMRRTINDALTDQRHWPVVDFATALADPDQPTRLNPVYDSGDGIHPSDSGAQALAQAIDLTLVNL